jgi:hypothetical protein
MDNHCDELILRPFQFVSHLCYAYNHEDEPEFTWNHADSMAKRILDEYGFAGMKTPDKLTLFENTSGKTNEPKEEE